MSDLFVRIWYMRGRGKSIVAFGWRGSVGMEELVGESSPVQNGRWCVGSRGGIIPFDQHWRSTASATRRSVA